MAFTQFLPILQFGAGLLALVICHQVDMVESELGGLLVTVVTGGLLVAVALSIGRRIPFDEGGKPASSKIDGLDDL